MATLPPTSRPDQASAKASDARIDHALALLLADQPEAALQWAAAVVERQPAMASALVVTSRLLEQLGRSRAAVEGLHRAVDCAVETGNLPLAMAAIGDLRSLGVDVHELLDQVAGSFCRGSPRLEAVPASSPPQVDDFQPLSPFLTGPALASKATQILHGATAADGATASDSEPRLFAPVPLFSALSQDALRRLLSAFETVTVPAGRCVVREGEAGAAAYIVACGELEVSRLSGEGRAPIVLARLGPGSFFGEMELLSEMPRSATLTAVRPSILLVAKRDALDAVAAERPDVAAELTAHCRSRVVANLGRGSPLLNDVPPQVRAKLLERFETRLFRKGEKLVREGEEPQGLHLVVSGEVVVVAHESGEPVLLATLAPGETVGDSELILCRAANADAIAAHPTATLFLPRWEFFSLVQEHPALLPGMYMAAVRRHSETKLALEAAYVVVTDGYALDESASRPAHVVSRPSAGDLGAVATTRRVSSARIPGEDLVAAEFAARIDSTQSSARAVAPADRAGRGAHGSSVAPISASVQTAAPSEFGRMSLRWLATAGAAGLAAAAAVALVLWSSQGRFAGRFGAASGGASEGPTPSDTARATLSRPNAAAAAPVPAMAIAAPVAAQVPARPAIPRARPVAAVRPASASVATTTPSAASAPLPRPLASIVAAPEATGAGGPPAGPKASARAESTNDDFGGRN